MSHLEPTYLRYIYDGLNKGIIHPENSADLPDGLIGLYEEAFDERTSVIERQKLLNRFAIWALLKKEVSAAFVAEVLEEPEEEIQNFISTYSAWFNSPGSSKYQLYHERLKVYLLQKLSEGEVAKLNGLILNFLEQKVNDENENDSVQYCFENLSFHLFLNGYFTGNSALFAQYCLDDNFKKRQFELSGYYDWEEKMMALGVEYFSLNQDSICHQIVFEKTKILYKKKDIDLILSLIRNGETETVFRFFQNTHEENLHVRVELAYFYFLSFFEIFEINSWSFINKKETGNKLLQIFEENFQWDNEYWLSSYIDVNVSFRLHCYFEQYGLDFTKIAKLSSDSLFMCYDFASNSELKFIGLNHLEEGERILTKYEDFNYEFEGKNFKNLQISDFYTATFDLNSLAVNDRIRSLTKTQLIRSQLSSIGEESNNFVEIYQAIKFTLKIGDLSRDLKNKILKLIKQIIKNESHGLFSISGMIENSEGKSTLAIERNKPEQNQTLPDLISRGLVLNDFINISSESRYVLLTNDKLNTDDDIELLLFFLEVSEYYQKNEFNDLINLFSKLLVEFHLNINDDLINKYIGELINLIEESTEESEVFENVFFNQLLDFLDLDMVTEQLKMTIERLKEKLLEAYFNFSIYNYAFVVGCKLINLFSKHEVNFPEDTIFEQLLEDLQYLIEENNYNEMWVIESSQIKNIYQKSYFWDFYNYVNRIKIEQVRNYLSNYIYEDIIKIKGLNQSTVLFFRYNSKDFPGMYKWAKNALSEKISQSDYERSYLLIIERNDLLLERLLLNIVSERVNCKDKYYAQILKYYGLTWVDDVYNEYEKLISAN